MFRFLTEIINSQSNEFATDTYIFYSDEYSQVGRSRSGCRS